MFAQGSYESLIDHPYIVEITDIHSKNKNELKRANENKNEDKENKSEEMNRSADFEMPQSTSEEEAET